MAAAKRNFEHVLSLPIDSATEIAEGIRVKIDSNGEVVAAGDENGIGTTVQHVNGANQASSYGVCAVQLNSCGKHLLKVAEGSTFSAGDTFYAAASGEIADSGTIALGQITVAASEGNYAEGIFFAPTSAGALVNLNATSLTVTAATHGGKTIKLSHTAAESTVTLPAATGTGIIYRFVVGAVNTNNHVIEVANATDVFKGMIFTNSTGDTPDLAQPWPTAADSDTITLNGTTTGGQAIGDYIEIQDIASGVFRVLGFTSTSGTEATPFSAAVS